MPTAKLDSVKNHPGGAGFGGMRESWRAADTWHWERPGEATAEASVIAVEGPGLTGSFRDVAAHAMSECRSPQRTPAL